jgi:hypothetical protein
MLFSNRDPDHRSHVLRIVRDVVEVVAIVAAGLWAFYVFVYENRIKPSLTDPQIGIGATLQKTSQRNGTVGVLLKTEVRNTGTVRFYFAGYSITVLGTRVTSSRHSIALQRSALAENAEAFYQPSKPVPVYSFAFLTSLGNAKSKQDLELEPAGSVDQAHTFYVPADRFDLLTAHVELCFTKSDYFVGAYFLARRDGAIGVSCGSPFHVAYDAGSLDLR